MLSTEFITKKCCGSIFVTEHGRILSSRKTKQKEFAKINQTVYIREEEIHSNSYRMQFFLIM